MSIIEITRAMRDWPFQARSYLCWRVALSLEPVVDCAKEIHETERYRLKQCMYALKEGITSIAPDPGAPSRVAPDYLRHLFQALHGLVDYSIQTSSLEAGRSSMGMEDKYAVPPEENTLRIALASAEVIIPGLKRIIGREARAIQDDLSNGFDGRTIGNWIVNGDQAPLPGIDELSAAEKSIGQLKDNWGPPPAILYRYRKAEDVARDFESALNGKHWFASPVHLNDPFDSRPLYSMPAPQTFREESERRQWHEKETVEQALAQLSKPSDIEARQDSFLSNKALMCLSASPMNAQMWAHYAKNYTGYVIGLHSQKIRSVENPPTERLSSIWKVSYVSERPEIDPFAFHEIHPEELERIVFCKKAEGWKYEREWRCIANNTPPDRGRLIQVQPDCLAEVYLGPRMPQESKSLILRSLERQTRVAVHQVSGRLSRNRSYQLNSEPIAPSNRVK